MSAVKSFIRRKWKMGAKIIGYGILFYIFLPTVPSDSQELRLLAYVIAALGVVYVRSIFVNVMQARIE